jgi:hypothetical protein
MGSAKNSQDAGPALENRNWKLETGNSKLEVRDVPIGNRQSRIGNLYSGQRQGRWAEEKKFTPNPVTY